MGHLLTLFGSRAAPAAASSPLLADLVYHYKLNEVSGDGVDSHTNALTLTDNNTVTSGVGKLGGARQFTAANSEYLSRASEALLQPSGDFSLTCWFNLDSTGAQNVLLGKDNGTTSREYCVQLVSGSLLFRVWSLANDAGETSITWGSPFVLGTWYFVAAKLTGTTLSLSVNDGTPVTGTHNGGVYAGAASFALGRRQTGNYFDGRLDSASFWSRAISSGEITQLYNADSGLDYPFS